MHGEESPWGLKPAQQRSLFLLPHPCTHPRGPARAPVIKEASPPASLCLAGQETHQSPLRCVGAPPELLQVHSPGVQGDVPAVLHQAAALQSFPVPAALQIMPAAALLGDGRVSRWGGERAFPPQERLEGGSAGLHAALGSHHSVCPSETRTSLSG